MQMASKHARKLRPCAKGEVWKSSSRTINAWLVSMCVYIEDTSKVHKRALGETEFSRCIWETKSLLLGTVYGILEITS